MRARALCGDIRRDGMDFAISAECDRLRDAQRRNTRGLRRQERLMAANRYGALIRGLSGLIQAQAA